MTQIVLEHIDEAIVAKLAELARANRVSVEEQAQRLLIEAVDMVIGADVGWKSRIESRR